MNKMIGINEVSKLTGVTPKTLKIWDNENKFKCAYRTVGGHRRYSLEEVEKFIGSNLKSTNGNGKNVFVYCRVSTKKQQEAGNLERQKKRLIDYCKEKQYNIVEIFEETSSGLNDSRKQLARMFNRIKEVESIVIEYPDRLARFGYNYLRQFAETFNVEIETIEQRKKLEPNEEMVQDLISIVTFFSARLYGARGGRKLKGAIKELEKERGTACENNYKCNTN